MTGICRSAKFWLKHFGPMRPPPKFGTSQFFARQKLEVNKIGSSATRGEDFTNNDATFQGLIAVIGNLFPVDARLIKA